MAAYLDQFDRRDPKSFKATGLFDFWSEQAAWEARAILKHRSSDVIVAIAKAIEESIRDYCQPFVASARLNGIDHSNRPVKLRSPSIIAVGEDGIRAFREHHGDLNILRHLGGASILVRWLPDGLQVEDHEALAVLALWKLVDMYDELRGEKWFPPRESDSLFDEEPTPVRPAPKQSVQARIRNAAPLMVEASRASAIAVETMMNSAKASDAESAAQALKVELEAKWVQQSARRASERARELASKRHAQNTRTKAIVFDWLAGKTYKSRAAAAREAHKFLTKHPDAEVVLPETINDWLKRAGWVRDGWSPPAID